MNPSTLQQVVVNIQREVSVITSPSQKIIAMLQRIQKEYMSGSLLSSKKQVNPEKAVEMVHSLNYVIDKIGHRTLYKLNSVTMDD